MEDAIAIREATPPATVEPAKLQETEARAQALIAAILKDPEDRTSVREATSVGEHTVSQANADFKLLRTSMGKVMDRMKESGDTTSIPADLKKLRNVMDEINPYPAIEQMKRSQTAGFFSRLLGRVPGVGKILKDIAQRYESVQTQVNAIIQSLESGGDKLLENTLELEERYKRLRELKAEVELSGYLLQLALQKLEEAKEAEVDENRKMALQKAEARIVRRLQNLKVTENAFAQFFVTMNTTMDNHENLRDAIRSMIDLTRPVLENGLALKIAQQEEKQIAEALEASQDYLGNLMVAVAQDSMDNAEQIAKTANQPLVKFESLVKSYNILINRMDQASKVEQQMIASAKENIDKIDEMTKELDERSRQQEAGREAGKLVEDV